MNIAIDYEISRDEIIFSPKGIELIEALKGFIYKQVKVLEDEINLHPNGFIIIHLFGTIQGITNTISFTLFPDDLTEKLKTCVTDRDIAYLFHLFTTYKDE